uniref:Uncharacterized protein n=1 Tax=Hemiselmis andersenii TaxID=464988 RepID=A0A7S1HCC0_HEMAN
MAVAKACKDDVTTQTVSGCVQMTVHNFMGTKVSMPIWGCLSPHLTYIGVNGGVNERQTITGTTLVNTVFDESVSMMYRTNAFSVSPPMTPAIPTFTAAQRSTVASDVNSLLGPSSLSYTSCAGPDPCNALPTPSTRGCFTLKPGALYSAKAAVDAGRTTEALTALSNDAMSCANVPGHVDTCLSVTFSGTPIMGGCWSPMLEGVAMPDLMGGAIKVDCGDGTASGVMPIPPAFVFGLPVPFDQILFTCCKGDLCNIDGAPTSGVLTIGVDIVIEVAGFSSTSDFVARGKTGTQQSVAGEVGVGASSVFATTCCEGTDDEDCTWFIQPPAGQIIKNTRRQAGPITVTVHVNRETRRNLDISGGTDRRAMTQDEIFDTANKGTFETTLLTRMKAAMPDVSGLSIKIKAVEKADGNKVRPPNALSGGSPRLSFWGGHGAWALAAAALALSSVRNIAV